MAHTNEQGQTVLTVLEDDKEWIDQATYEQLFYQHRFAPPGHRFFIGDTGTYYKAMMKKKASTMTHEEIVAVSKKIGWTPND